MSRLPIQQILPGDRSLGTALSADRTQVACLTNGRYSVQLNARGSGHSDWRGVAMTRASADRICDADGFHIYVRDLDDHSVWSAAYQPTRVAADEYQFHYSGSVAEVNRRDRELECCLTVCVPPDLDCELRRCRLTNHSNRTRRIEITSYLEWVLTVRDADANHPAFSKLFVETQYCADRHAILARRRPRSGDEPLVWGFHALVCDASRGLLQVVEFETNRAAFIGRGRSLARPRALDANVTLTGQAGPVLDPIASLRMAVSLEPDESCDLAFMLGAASRRDSALETLTAVGGLSSLNTLLRRAREDAGANYGKPRVMDGLGRAREDGDRYILHPPHRRTRAHANQPQISAARKPANGDGPKSHASAR